ncbi:acyltransferase family protein [Alkalibacillus aidingensis]|uniref:acyltransferase family protein n=1 Tax=Alkalibacillus aidingensis TaxID=2747607 RepID=UPI0016612C05|nr:acyltransferase family protein [Alkalibacillus aidingensis]
MKDLRSPEKRFRPEIEGVRALAAMLVAVYHIWLGSVSGGVDVFFIVSGYLITTSLLTKVERSGRINIFEYLLGLARRLLPLALTVVFVTTAHAIFILPQVQWGQTISQVFSSIFYYQNWMLANNSVDYLAQNNEASPFQHFWALSIQGQFYVTWPLLILLTYFLARKLFKTPIRKTFLTILVIIFVASLSYSVYITATNQPWAYFDTFARVWEFSLGGMLAVLIPYLSFHRLVSLVVGWLGFAIISLTGLILPVSDVFPGYAALLPISGVILIIISAENASQFGVQRLLGSKALVYLGSISYAFYLWHWPLLIFYYHYFNRVTVPFVDGVLILLGSFILSILSAKLLETPIRGMSVRTQKRRLAVVLSAFIIPVLAIGLSWNQYINQVQEAEAVKASNWSPEQEYIIDSDDGEAEQEEDETIYTGPEPSKDVFETAIDDLQPSLIHVTDDLPVIYDDESCYSSSTDPTVNICSMGETENPDYTVALVGGSHSGHWYPALEVAASELNLQIDLYLKDACRYSTDDFDGQLSESCVEWAEQVDEPLIENAPDLVITTASVAGGTKIPQGYLDKWELLEGHTHILALRDNPRMQEDVPACLEEKGIEDCVSPRNEVLYSPLPWENTDGIPDHVSFADFSDRFCDDELCYPVVDDMIVYRDKHHITAVYSRALGPLLTKEIADVLDEIES